MEPRRPGLEGVDNTNSDTFRAGAAYLFGLTTGAQIAKLQPVSIQRGANFGYSVAMEGNRALIGAAATESSTEPGNAYLFDLTTGNQLAELVPAGPGGGDRFGASVVLEGDRALVGATHELENSSTGSVYVFDIPSLAQTSGIRPDGYQRVGFGSSISIDNGWAVIGADAFNQGRNGTNAAFLYDLAEGAFAGEFPINSGNLGFGYSVSLHDNIAIIGSPFDDVHATNSGSAHLFDVTNATSPPKIPVIQSERLANQFIVTFSYEPGHTEWLAKGSANLSSFDDDLTSVPTFTEPSPGTYPAEIDLGPSAPSHYFVRIER